MKFFLINIQNLKLKLGFHERDGKPYCKKDYFDMFAPRCAGCNQAIMENYISALNSQFHPDCFVCRVSKNFIVKFHNFYSQNAQHKKI